MARLLSFVLFSYLLGSLPVGVLLSRLKGQDPRKTGSGNIGATNVMRTAGKALGIITLLGDMLKGLLPVLLAMAWQESTLLVALVGLAAFVGHLFPVYLAFKGGKGVATALGVLLALDPLSVLGGVVAFALVLWKWSYVSLGSLIGTALVPIILVLRNAPRDYIALTTVIAILIFIKHKENIKRLLAGKENKLGAGR